MVHRCSITSAVLGLATPLLLLLLTSRRNWLHLDNEDAKFPTLQKRRLQEEEGTSLSKMKILYTITSLAEYNTGSRATVKGSDRLQETLIPIVSEGVHSMLSFGYQIDVFLVCHYILQPERLKLIQDSLPEGVGLRHWDDAMPLGYDTGNFHNDSKIGNRDISLARQHRFVVRDNLFDYDVFVNFEDDMLIKGETVDHFLNVTRELQRLKAAAPEDLPGNPSRQYYDSAFSGPMNKGQLKRMFPGFIRVEALLDPSQASRTRASSVPKTLDFGDGKGDREVDPKACCHVSPKRSSPKRPADPKPSDIIFWETAITPLGVRKMPDGTAPFLEWVTLLRGPTYGQDTADNIIISDYWSGRDGYYREELKNNRRPGGNARNYINNQGGWMATRQQIWEWHTEVCPGGFLPPYDTPHYRFDGLDLRDVEWWSGGIHLVSKRHACNMQRVVSIDPDHFSYHLLYHTANNKQAQLGLPRFTKATDLMGELNTVRNNAERVLAEEKAKAS